MAISINDISRALSVIILCAAFAATGCYDDSSIQQQLKDHESRLEELERLTAQQNTNIASLQAIVTAIQNMDYVTGVAPIKEGDEVIGYTLIFSKSGAVTLYDGLDADAPLMGVKCASDGLWYWTVDGEWLLDSMGRKVRASAVDGEQGQPGVTPELKIVDGYWYVSYDGGTNWEEESLGQATGDDGYTMFAEVMYDETYVYITMADGEKLILPRTSSAAGPLTYSEGEIMAFTALFYGHLDVPESELPYSQVTLFYSDEANFHLKTAESVTVISFDENQDFVIDLKGLKFSTKYNYCFLTKVKSQEFYTEIRSFTTAHPYLQEANLDMDAAADVSSVESSNCYVISDAGLYKFKAVKGNSDVSVGDVASSLILWETFGTADAPSPCDLIGGVCYKDDFIAFQTSDTFKEGSGVIAAVDSDGDILWSWHIWFTDNPQEQEYFNAAGVMMDRNLGASSAVPGDVDALGLLYQWGRKDPFLGSSSVNTSVHAQSTYIWPSAVASASMTGTIEYATSHPTVFISSNSANSDWYYTGSEQTDNTRWATSDLSKSMYDPCPAGWRVPDGGDNGVWTKAIGSSGLLTFESLYDQADAGMNFSDIFGTASIIWYPAAGYRSGSSGELFSVGSYGYCWGSSPAGRSAYCLGFTDKDKVAASSSSNRAYACSVRCQRSGIF